MSDHRFPRSLTLLGLLLAVGAGTTAQAQVMTDPDLNVITVVDFGDGLQQPTTMKFVADDDFLVLEKATGRVRRVLNDTLQPGFALDVHVNSSSERGMLGIAVAPGAPLRVFLYYTEAAGADNGPPLANRVYRYDWDPSAGPSGALTNPQLVLDLPVIPGPNHDGGVILIDSQGLLYAMIGDLNHNGQLQNNPPGLPPDDTGVIFRVNQDGTAAAGNPFTPYCSVTTTQTCTATPDCPVGQTCVTNVARYYAYGVRNGFGLEFDPVSSALWMSENGPDIMDELNRIDAGVNSGWNQLMGPDALDPQGTGDLWNMPNEGLTYSDPEFSWMDTVAVTGVIFPFGTTWGPAYNDKVLVGDSNLGNIYSFPMNGTRTGLEVPALPPSLQDLVANNQGEANLVRIGQAFGAITDLEKGPDDDVYVIDISGRVFRIEGPVPVTLQGFTVE
jgi:glucose/arabinose dehydrogenase